MNTPTRPSRPLIPRAGEKVGRYVPAANTDIRRTFEKARRLQSAYTKAHHAAADQ